MAFFFHKFPPSLWLANAPREALILQSTVLTTYLSTRHSFFKRAFGGNGHRSTETANHSVSNLLATPPYSLHFSLTQGHFFVSALLPTVAVTMLSLPITSYNCPLLTRAPSLLPAVPSAQLPIPAQTFFFSAKLFQFFLSQERGCLGNWKESVMFIPLL